MKSHVELFAELNLPELVGIGEIIFEEDELGGVTAFVESPHGSIFAYGKNKEEARNLFLHSLSVRNYTYLVRFVSLQYPDFLKQREEQRRLGTYDPLSARYNFSKEARKFRQDFNENLA